MFVALDVALIATAHFIAVVGTKVDRPSGSVRYRQSANCGLAHLLAQRNELRNLCSQRAFLPAACARVEKVSSRSTPFWPTAEFQTSSVMRTIRCIVYYRIRLVNMSCGRADKRAGTSASKAGTLRANHEGKRIDRRRQCFG
jgi:hypothetical protein